MGAIIEGHGRRALAAFNALQRNLAGARWQRERWASRLAISAAWVIFHDTCGCTPEQHAAHAAESAASGIDWVECDCVHAGLPPCGTDHSWSYDQVEQGTPGALPVTAVVADYWSAVAA